MVAPLPCYWCRDLGSTNSAIRLAAFAIGGFAQCHLSSSLHQYQYTAMAFRQSTTRCESWRDSVAAILQQHRAHLKGHGRLGNLTPSLVFRRALVEILPNCRSKNAHEPCIQAPKTIRR